MAKGNDEISSTEKLLNQIRGESKSVVPVAEEIKIDSPPPPPAASPPIVTSPKKKPSWLKLISPAQNISIGVDIDVTKSELRLAKIDQTSEKNRRLLQYQKVSFGPEILRTSPEFSTLLKKTMTGFCGGSGKNFDIWCNIPSAHVELRHLRIPKVPRKQLAKAVQFAFRKEVPFEEQNSLFDFEVLGNVTESGVGKIAIVAYTASRAEVQAIKNIFSKCGFPLTGITIVPFGIQNFLRSVSVKGDAGKIVCNLYIGTDWSRIDVFHHGNLVMMRGVKTGLNSMSEAIVDELNSKWAMVDTSSAPQEAVVELGGAAVESGEADFDLSGGDELLNVDDSDDTSDEPVSLSMENEWALDQEGPINAEEARRILFSLSPEGPALTEDDPGFKLPEEEIHEMIYPAVERLVRQIERTFQHFSSMFHGETVGKIFISGKVDLSGYLTEYITKQLGIQGEAINPFSPEIPFAQGLSIAAPRNFSEKVSYAAAIGLALSDNSRTPNFIYTYIEKGQKAIISKFDRVVFVLFLLVMVICVSISLWQGKESKEKNQQVAQLKQQQEAFTPEPDENLIANLATKVALKRQKFKKYSQRYRGMAAIGEISALTPGNISLLSSTSTLPKGPDGKGTLILEGIVRGKRRILEATLASYVLKLAGSPLFEQPSVNKSVIEPENDSDVLHFIVHIEM